MADDWETDNIVEVTLAHRLGTGRRDGYGPAQWRSPWPSKPPVEVIVPPNTCGVGLEPQRGRCVPDCVSGPCKRVKVAEAQTTFRDAAGRTLGTAAAAPVSA
jgi:hypothetical protein